MSDEILKPNNEKPDPNKIWNLESFGEEHYKYASDHVISHDPNKKRELYLQFFCMRPGKDAVSVARLILNPLHAQELILNLQSQLQKMREDLPPPRR